MLLIDDYKLEYKLGSGSFADVYYTTRKNSKEIFATKRVEKAKALSDKMKNYFLNEVDILKNTNHKNIIKLYEIKNSQKNFYLIMEFCNGGTLQDLFDKHYDTQMKPFPESFVQHILRQISCGLYYLHKSNIIHRDLKMENILFHFDSDEDKNKMNILKAQLKIIDFGFAKYLTDSTIASSICGSPINMDPMILKALAFKQIGQDFGYTEKADMWSLGIMVYTMLIGKPPFIASNYKDLYLQINEGNYQIPKLLKLSKQAISLINGLLQFDTKERLSIDELVFHEFLTKEEKDFEYCDLNYIDKGKRDITLNNKEDINKIWDNYQVANNNNVNLANIRGNLGGKSIIDEMEQRNYNSTDYDANKNFQAFYIDEKNNIVFTDGTKNQEQNAESDKQNKNNLNNNLNNNKNNVNPEINRQLNNNPYSSPFNNPIKNQNQAVYQINDQTNMQNNIQNNNQNNEFKNNNIVNYIGDANNIITTTTGNQLNNNNYTNNINNKNQTNQPNFQDINKLTPMQSNANNNLYEQINNQLDSHQNLTERIKKYEDREREFKKISEKLSGLGKEANYIQHPDFQQNSNIKPNQNHNINTHIYNATPSININTIFSTGNTNTNNAFNPISTQSSSNINSNYQISTPINSNEQKEKIEANNNRVHEEKKLQDKKLSNLIPPNKQNPNTFTTTTKNYYANAADLKNNMQNTNSNNNNVGAAISFDDRNQQVKLPLASQNYFNKLDLEKEKKEQGNLTNIVTTDSKENKYKDFLETTPKKTPNFLNKYNNTADFKQNLIKPPDAQQKELKTNFTNIGGNYNDQRNSNFSNTNVVSNNNNNFTQNLLGEIKPFQIGNQNAYVNLTPNTVNSYTKENLNNNNTNNFNKNSNISTTNNINNPLITNSNNLIGGLNNIYSNPLKEGNTNINNNNIKNNNANIALSKTDSKNTHTYDYTNSNINYGNVNPNLITTTPDNSNEIERKNTQINFINNINIFKDLKNQVEYSLEQFLKNNENLINNPDHNNFTNKLYQILKDIKTQTDGAINLIDKE